MTEEISRRSFLGAAAASLVAARMKLMTSMPSNITTAAPPIKQIHAGELDIGYYDIGADSKIGVDSVPVVLLLHGWPYSTESYVDVAPMLASRGCRVIVPHLRGHGTTRFLDASTPRSGEQAAMGVDVIALVDALGIKRAVLAGYDWGGRAACVAAALWPERVSGLVSVNSYLIQDIAHADTPAPATTEAAFWYQFYFLTERGRNGLSKNRREIAKLMWTRNSPTWAFDDATFERSAVAFDNPDYVDVVLHSYRHRLGHADGYPAYAQIEKKLAALPPILVGTITLDGDSDGVVAATDGKSSAAKFTGPREHRIVKGVGHNLPQEDPEAFADAVWTLASAKR